MLLCASVLVLAAAFASAASAVPPPPHDAFSAPQALAGAAGSVTGTNAGATKQLGEPDHGNPTNRGGASVWFTWTPPAGLVGSVTFDTLGSGFDTLLSVYTGSSLSSLVMVAGDDDVGKGRFPKSSRASFLATPGTTYRIAVDGYAKDAAHGPETGEYVLSWRRTVEDGAQVSAGLDATIGEGSEFVANGSFVDPAHASWTASVDYGDGSPVQPLAIGPGNTFTLRHRYADDRIYTVTVLVIADADGAAGSDSLAVTVNNVVPTVDAGPSATIVEGDLFASTGSFSDPGTDPWTATVDYGDGTGVQALPLTGKNFTLSHEYAQQGTYPVVVRVSDGGPAPGVATATVTVLNAAPLVDAGPNRAVSEGGVFASAGTFVDPGADTWSATVDYGDGTGVQPLALTGKTFALSHAYARRGSYTVTVAVSDGSTTSVGTARADVAGVSPTVVGGGNAAILEGGTLARTGTFFDPGADDWTATVDYGDGTGIQPLPLSGKTFSLGHLYARDGTYTVTVSVSDGGPVTGVDTFTVDVANVAPAVSTGGNASIIEGSTLSRAGSFSDPGADLWTATVDYGDGTGVQPLALSGKTFSLGHLYPRDGTYTVTVEVSDGGPTPGVSTFVVDVANVVPAVSAGPGATIEEGAAFVSAGSFTDPGADLWTATVDYGDGTGPQPLVLAGKTFALDHVYESQGVYTVAVTVSDATATGTATATVTAILLDDGPGNEAACIDHFHPRLDHVKKAEVGKVAKVRFQYCARRDFTPARIAVRNLDTGLFVPVRPGRKSVGDAFRRDGKHMLYEWDTAGLPPGLYQVFVQVDGVASVPGPKFRLAND